MSKQSRKKKAEIYNELLRKRSRNISLLAAAILYIAFIMSIYGSGYMFFFFGTIATVLFAIVFAVVYYPARACVEIFLNIRLSKKKRYAFLLLVLIPYLLAIAFCTYMYLDYYFYSISPEYAPTMA